MKWNDRNKAEIILVLLFLGKWDLCICGESHALHSGVAQHLGSAPDFSGRGTAPQSHGLAAAGWFGLASLSLVLRISLYKWPRPQLVYFCPEWGSFMKAFLWSSLNVLPLGRVYVGFMKRSQILINLKLLLINILFFYWGSAAWQFSHCLIKPWNELQSAYLALI